MNIQFRCLSILLFSPFILLHGCVKNKEQKKPEGISIFEKWKGGILEWLANEKNNNEN